MRFGFGFVPVPGQVRRLAPKLERLGFDSLAVTDHPLGATEHFSQMMLACELTDRIEIGGGVTVAPLRHPAVTASALNTLQFESGGRVFCGIGRGDAAVFTLGREPQSMADFDVYLTELRRLLDGGIRWSPGLGLPRVPLDVAVSGPRMCELAGRHADRITFGVGADPVVVGDWVRQARDAVERAGRDPDSVEYGAYTPCVLADDVDTAISGARHITAIFARFSAMRGQRSDRSIPAKLASTAEAVDRAIGHAPDLALDVEDIVPREFVEWFAVAGGPEMAVERFRALAEVGLDHVQLVSGFHELPPEVGERHLELVGTAVIPALREPGS